MTSSTLGEPETRDVPRRCSAQSHSAALSHLQPSCVGTNPVLLLPGLGGGSIPQPQTPASPTELPHHHPTAKPSSSPGCKSLYRHRCRSKISGAIPRVTPLKPFPRNLPGWKPSRSAAPAPLTSHTAHLLLFSLTPSPARATACLSLPTGSGTWAWRREKQATSQRGPLAYFPGRFLQEQKPSHEKVQAGSPAKAGIKALLCQESGHCCPIPALGGDSGDLCSAEPSTKGKARLSLLKIEVPALSHGPAWLTVFCSTF